VVEHEYTCLFAYLCSPAELDKAMISDPFPLKTVCKEYEHYGKVLHDKKNDHLLKLFGWQSL